MLPCSAKASSRAEAISNANKCYTIIVHEEHVQIYNPMRIINLQLNRHFLALDKLYKRLVLSTSYS
jgi:hypothetical protein